MNMEGFNIKMNEPENEEKIVSVETPEKREEKIERAQISYAKMFNSKMETEGTITSFEHPRN